MGFRFRRSISICPGVRLNIGKNGLSSLSVGQRGASVSVGKTGVYKNFGLPGTGFSHRTKLNATTNKNTKNKKNIDNSIELYSRLARCEQDISSIINVHMDTPNLHNAVSFERLESMYLSSLSQPFSVPEPERPLKPIPPAKPKIDDGWFSNLFSSREKREQEYNKSILRWEVQNTKDQTNYAGRLSAWQLEYSIWKKKKKNHQLDVIKASELTLKDSKVADSFFEQILTEELMNTRWPRETLVSFEVDSINSVIKLEVDLPEVEDMPQNNYRINARQSEILAKKKSGKQIRLEYARLVHGIIFRLAGISLYNIPCDYVEITGFTQRMDRKQGFIVDDYILNVLVRRDELEKVNFKRLDMIDPVIALEGFELKRDMTKTGIFKALSGF